MFVDADKPRKPDHVTWALRLTRNGSVITIDNLIRDGAVADDAGSAGPAVAGARAAIDLIAAGPRLSGAVQTGGTKGYDGFTMAVATADQAGSRT